MSVVVYLCCVIVCVALWVVGRGGTLKCIYSDGSVRKSWELASGSVPGVGIRRSH